MKSNNPQSGRSDQFGSFKTALSYLFRGMCYITVLRRTLTAMSALRTVR
jgi:hypothetical protein